MSTLRRQTHRIRYSDILSRPGSSVAADEVDDLLTHIAADNPHPQYLRGTDLGFGSAATKTVALSGDASAAQVVMGSDSRLTNARAPTAHTHPISDVSGLQAALDAELSARVAADLLLVPLGQPLVSAAAIAALTFSATPTQAECNALRDALVTLLQTLRMHA